MSYSDNPFAIQAFFDHSVVLTFAVPKQDLLPLIPKCMDLDTFQDKWAFIAVAMVQTKKLRPKGFPAFLGSDFFLVGYRIFVRFTNKNGKKRRGLYILKSETDSKRMEILGNLFSRYHYSTIDVKQEKIEDDLLITSQKAPFQVRFNKEKQAVPADRQEISLPPTSPFPDWKEARKFAGPMPFTFTYLPKKDKVLIVEGVRSNWTPRPIEVKHYDFPFLQQLKLPESILANAFILENIPYYWKKGILES